LRRHRKKLAQVARCQARGQLHIPKPDDDEPAEFDQALAAFGLQQGESDDAQIPDDKCYLWPCNVPVFNVWQQVQTQWRIGGMGERTGLDYAGVATHLYDVVRIKKRRWRETWIGLQAMERATLEVWAEKKN
jgi:hypothetical protein